MNRREAIAALMALPATASVSVAQVKPKDVIVIEHPGHITMEAAENIKALAQGIWPDHKVAVLSGGATLKVVKHDA